MSAVLSDNNCYVIDVEWYSFRVIELYEQLHEGYPISVSYTHLKSACSMASYINSCLDCKKKNGNRMKKAASQS